MNANEVLKVTPTKLKKSYQKAKESEYKYFKSYHLFTYRNSNFGEAFHTCYIEHNAPVFKAINSRYLLQENGKYYLITTNEARYKSWYKVLNYSTITGEVQEIIKESDSLIRQRGKVISGIKSFDRIYKPLYRAKKVSCLFGMLTNLPNAKCTIRMFMNNLKKACKRSGINLLSYLWVNEVKYKPKAKGSELSIHVHYHIFLAIERIEVTGGKLPNCLSEAYLTNLWGQKANVRFISGGSACMNYVNKYVSKEINNENGVCLGLRRYGASRNITKKP